MATSSFPQGIRVQEGIEGIEDDLILMKGDYRFRKRFEGRGRAPITVKRMIPFLVIQFFKES